MKHIAVVTGASAGIGREFALQLAERKDLDEIWVAARREERLLALQTEIAPGRLKVFCLDLSRPEDIAVLSQAYEAESVSIRVLVNNAGYGKMGAFARGDKAEQLGMIDVNVRALTELTYDAIPHMEAGCGIIQVASLAGFVPIANMAVYAATKAFVVNLSAALTAELAPRRIHCMAVCPGAVKTEFLNVATNGRRPFFPIGMTARRLVKRSLRSFRRKQWFSNPSLLWNLARYCSVMVPRKWVVWLTRKTMD